MKKLLFILTLAVFLISPLHVFASNDCTEWLGTWQVVKSGSTNYDRTWTINEADQSVAYGEETCAENPNINWTLRIVWSTEKGVYFVYHEYWGTIPLEVVLKGDSFTFKRDADTYQGTRVGAPTAAGSVVIDNNFDMTIKDMGLGDLKLDFVLKFYANPDVPYGISWYIDPASFVVH